VCQHGKRTLGEQALGQSSRNRVGHQRHRLAVRPALVRVPGPRP
jgi:hypothetical protein